MKKIFGLKDLATQNWVYEPAIKSWCKSLKKLCLLLVLVSFCLIQGCKKELQLTEDDTGDSAELPVILFVPGFTGAGLFDLLVDKNDYYKYQIPYFRNKKGRTVINMNDESGFDSDNGAIKCNAAAIARTLERLQQADRMVTIVSHSKGGHDVLHALITSNNEDKLKYNTGNTEVELGQLVNEHLWANLAGWVSLTTNFFEGEFPIEGSRTSNGCSAVTVKSPGTDIPFGECRTADDASSIYGNYPILKQFRKQIEIRQQYMRDHRSAISKLMKEVPTLCAYASYLPSQTLKINEPDNRGRLGRFNQQIRDESQETLKLRGANDGLVPARAARLPGAKFVVKLPGDPSTERCGVDHLAPALLPDKMEHRFWSPNFQVDKTREYINKVESVIR